MLGKLIKYEFKFTAGKYGLMYLVLAAYTLFVIGLGLIHTSNPFVTGTIGFLTGIYFIVLFGVCVCATGYAVVRFYKTMVSDEGYLTHTLPAKVEHIILSKFLVAYVFQFLTIILAAASAMLVVSLKFDVNLFSAFHSAIEELSALGENVVSVLIAFLVCALVSMAYQVLTYYVSIGVGQMLQGNKVVGCVLGYMIINTAVQVIVAVVSFGVSFIAGVSNGFENLESSISSVSGFTALLAVETVLMLVLAVVEYFVTSFCLKKKLNLN